MMPTAVFKTLSDPLRLQITLLLHSEGELCVCELTEALQQSQPKISRHLAQLRSSGLLLDRRQGQWVFYHLAESLPPWCLSLLTNLSQEQVEELAGFKAMLAGMQDRPARCC